MLQFLSSFVFALNRSPFVECCRVSVSQKKIHDRLVESGCVRSVCVLERFNADVVYSEAGVSCGGVGGTMSVGFVLYQRQPIRCRELPC